MKKLISLRKKTEEKPKIKKNEKKRKTTNYL